MGEPRETLSFDEVASALGTVERRRLLTELLVTDTDQPLPTETDGVAARTPRHLKLVHVDLPKLASLGLIEWHREVGTVQRGPEFEAMRPVLTLLSGAREDLPADYLPSDPAACGSSNGQ